MRQKDQSQLNSGTGAKGEAPSAAARETEASAAEACLERPAVAGPSMEGIVERENLKKALAQVTRNKGAAGIDGMTVEELPAHLKEHWLAIRAQLLDGSYKPQPVRRVEIPKASGGLRPLGIPTVLDRLIQQAVMQVLQAEWDGTLRDELRLPAGPLGASGGGTGAGVYCVRIRRRRGPRSGKVLRSGQPRHPDGAGCEAGRRQATPEADPRLSDRGCDGGRVGQPDGRGHAAGRSALAAVVEPDAGRAGQGTSEARPSLRALRRRLQHLCAQSESGRAGDGWDRTVPGKAPQAQGQQGQECGRQAEHPQVPGLQLYKRAIATTAHRAAGARPLQGESSGADATHGWAKPCADRQEAVGLPDRVARLLRLLPDAVDIART